MIPRAVALFVVGLAACVTGQTAPPGIKAERVFVGSFGAGDQAARIRQAMVEELRRHGKVKVVDSPEAADGVLTGAADVWIKGYYSLNPRVRTVAGDAHPVYGGYLSVELKGMGNTVLWSYLATPRRFGPDAISANLAEQVVKKLRQAMDR